MSDTPDWLKNIEIDHNLSMITTAPATLEQIDYAVGVLVAQALGLQKMIDNLRRQILTQAQEERKDATE